jgi:acetyl esterase/lipase
MRARLIKEIAYTAVVVFAGVSAGGFLAASLLAAF